MSILPLRPTLLPSQAFMAALPRIRQLRRDKTIFNLALNVVRLHLEEHDLLAQPAQHESLAADIALVQQGIDRWVNVATGYLVRKYHCSVGQALQLLSELQAELKANIPVAEIAQVPLSLLLTPEQVTEQPPLPAS